MSLTESAITRSQYRLVLIAIVVQTEWSENLNFLCNFVSMDLLFAWVRRFI